jgi:hypothetical protein
VSGPWSAVSKEPHHFFLVTTEPEWRVVVAGIAARTVPEFELKVSYAGSHTIKVRPFITLLAWPKS